MIFKPWIRDTALRPRARSAEGAALRVRWLGTAGHVVESARTTLLIDPFLTRPSLIGLLRRLRPDEAAIAARIPARVDAILCGHSHYDHLLDAPTIARRTGALLCGSASTVAFGRAAGLPDAQLRPIPPGGDTFTVGDLEIQFVPSLHGRIFFGRVPFPGEARGPSLALPARAWHYRMGGAFGLVVRAAGATLYHNGSADLIDAALDGLRADVLLVGLAGRRATPDYLKRLASALRPSLVVPTHHDAFFAPLERGVHLLPGVDLDGFAREVRQFAACITPDYDEVLAIPPNDARGAVLLD
jgi:L-ascorbate metabolism protein UlaG (beta-lactamase superfamily)